MRVCVVLRVAIVVALFAFSSSSFAQTQVNQVFNTQGPAPSFGPTPTVQSGDSPPNGSVAGAVQAILPDAALGANTIFIGSSNGGIWETTNGGTSWSLLTASQATNSIASLSLDPTNATGNTIIAGTGVTSNGLWNYNTGYNARGALQNGLLYSTNGGATWTDLGTTSALEGESVIGVAARGNTILAATFEEQQVNTTTSALGNAYGLYRSTNGGTSFTLVSGAAGSGLPAGAVTSLVADPNNPTKFYAAVTSLTNTAASVYVSTDTGATWTPIFTNTTAISGGGTNVIGATTNQLVLKLAAGPGNSVAIAVVDTGAGTIGPQQILTGLYLSQNSGGTWSQLGTPATNAGSNQAAVNLALTIDPTNTSIVYITGDAISTSPYTLAAFKVQGSTITSITNGGTGNGSTVHADSRAAVFDAAGNLLVSSDGGIYQRSNPQSSSGVWTTLNTSTLSIREPYKLAYDSNSNLMVVAAQDTGVALQSTPTSPLYNAIQPADGTNATLNDKTLSGQTAIYTSYYNFGGLSRLIINSNGTAASPTPSPAGIPITCNTVSCGTFINGAANDFAAPIVLNRINPTLIAMGGSDLYVTQDSLTGANGVSATSINLTLTDVGTTGTCDFVTNYNCITTIAYGTRDNTNVLIAGTVANNLYISTTAAAGSLTQLTAYSGGAPNSLVFDPRSSARFYVTDGTNLWGTSNTGSSFTNLTANLPSSFNTPTSVEFISNNGVNALLVGGVNDVANAQSPIDVADSSASGILSNWRPFGTGLPNELVSVLNYNPTDDVLAVGLVGGGDWVLYDVTSYFPQATVLQFGLANNNSQPDASFLTDGTVVGGRPLIKYGTGTLLIDGSATYSGTTTINGGTIQLGDGTNTGSLLGTGDVITAAGTHIVVEPGIAAAGEIGGNISGPADLTQNGPGTFILLGANTYSGGTTINGGILQLGNGGTTGSLTGNVTDGGTFAIDRSNTYTYGGVISGGGSFIQVGTGTTIFTNANTYGGGTAILAGTLQIGNGGATGSIIGNVADAGTFAIDLSNTYTFAGNISGPGSFQQLGTGTTVFTGANSYGGTTTVVSGTLQAGAANTFSPSSANIVDLGGILDLHGFNQTIGSLAGAGNVTLGAGTLTTGGDNTNTIFSGAISGTGGLTKQGTGNFFLTGNSGYTGPTNVDGGVLVVNGSIVSAVTVNSGATLAGVGSVGPTTVNSGGTLAPGDAIGTMTVNGNLTFNAGSSFQVSILGNTNDRTNATGSASLAGSVDAVFLSTTNLQHSYTILSAAGGLSGSFTSLDTPGLPNFITASLVDTPTDVDLTVTSQLSQIPGLTQNQKAVAGGLDFSFNNGGGTLPNLLNQPASAFPAILNAISGEGISGTQETAFGAGDMFLSTMMDQEAFWRSGSTIDPIGVTSGPMAMGYAPEKSDPMVFKAPIQATFEGRWRAWFTGLDSNWKLSGDPTIGSATLSHRTGGGAGGVDYELNPGLLVGFALGGSDSSFSVPDRSTSGSEDAAHLGIYGVQRWGSLYAAAAMSFAGISDRTTRTIAAGFSPTETATGSFGSELLNGRLEVGWERRFGNIVVTPFAAVQFGELWQSGFTETSTTTMGAPGILGLTYASTAVPSLPTFLGTQLDGRWVTSSGMVWTPYARVSWVHEFEPDRNITASLISLPLATFTVDGPRAASDSARVEAGSKFLVAKNIWFFGNFIGEFSNTSQMYAGKGGVEVSW